MRINAATVVTGAILAGAVQAHGDHGAQKVMNDDASSASASAQSVVAAATDAAKQAVESVSSVASAALPTFTVSLI